MSSHPVEPSHRLTVPALKAMKGRAKIVTLTAYTAPIARAFDEHADLLLVGDSLAMVVYGEESTLGIGLDTMIRHGRAVVRASAKALVVVDLPFGSYQESPAQAFAASARVLQETGAAAVKLEGGAEMAETVAFLVARGIPVMAHVGLMPQHVHAMGGYRWQGRDEAEQDAILSHAKAVAEAGAFAIVLEGIDRELAGRITASLSIPTIGIGAGAACDGQVLVADDILGMLSFSPRFVKRYAELAKEIEKAAAAFAAEVRAGSFPGVEQSYGKKS